MSDDKLKEAPHIIYTPGVKYGLHTFKKEEEKVTSIFGDVSSDEEEEYIDPKKRMAMKSFESHSQMMASKVQKEALEEDPTVYSFDEVYEDIVEKREREDAIRLAFKKKDQESAKYIPQMLKIAQERKKEYERIKEAKIQKQIEEEKKILGETDVFITSAYKEKLMQEKKWQLEQQKLKEKEEREDVTKRGTMTHFYSNLSKNVALGGLISMKPTDESQKKEEEQKSPEQYDKRRSPDSHRRDEKYDRRRDELDKRDYDRRSYKYDDRRRRYDDRRNDDRRDDDRRRDYRRDDRRRDDDRDYNKRSRRDDNRRDDDKRRRDDNRRDDDKRRRDDKRSRRDDSSPKREDGKRESSPPSEENPQKIVKISTEDAIQAAKQRALERLKKLKK